MTTTEHPTSYRAVAHTTEPGDIPGWTRIEILAGDKVVQSESFGPVEVENGDDVAWAEWVIKKARWHAWIDEQAGPGTRQEQIKRLGGITAAGRAYRGELVPEKPVASIICDAPQCSATTDRDHPGGWVHVEHLRPTGVPFGGWHFCSWYHLADFTNKYRS